MSGIFVQGFEMGTVDTRKMSLPGRTRSFMKKYRDRGLALRMTPMIDLIFLLLTFFLLTVRFRPQENFLPVGLPRLSEAAGSAGIVEPLVITISSGGGGVCGGAVSGVELPCRIDIAGQKTIFVQPAEAQRHLADFARQLGEVISEQKRSSSDPLCLRYGDQVSWDMVAKTYNVIYGLGVRDITIGISE